MKDESESKDIAPEDAEIKNNSSSSDDYESLYRLATEYANDGIIIAVGENIVYINSRLLLMLGYSSVDEIADIPLIAHVHQDDREMVRGNIRKRQTAGIAPALYECRLLRSDGSFIHVEVSSSLIRYKGEPASLGYIRDISDRKNIEETLRRYEERYRLIADNTYSWEFWISPEWKFLYSSPSCERITGYTASEFEDDPGLFLKIIHPEDKLAVSNHLKETVHDISSVYDIEFRIIRRDGSTRWIGHLCQPVFDKNNICLGRRGSNRDITDRKSSESALRESELRYKSLFEYSVDAILILDAEQEQMGKIISANRAAEKMYGYTRDEMLKLRIHDLDTPESARHVPERMEHLLLENLLLLEVIHRRKDGSEFPIEVSANAINISGHRYILAIHRDITERRHAEEKLRESRSLYETLAERSLAGIYVVEKGTFKFINRQAASYAGYNPEELIGKRSDSIVHPEDRTKVKQKARLMLSKTEHAPYEFRIIAKDGNIRWMMETVTYIQYEGGNAVLGNSMDVTESKEAEEQRKALEEQLHQSQKMQAIGTLAGGIAHDFNTILGAISGYTELSREKSPPGSKVTNYLEQIDKALQRGIGLVSQILDFSRQSEKDLRPISLGPLVKETLKLLRPAIPSNIEIRSRLEASQDIILADTIQVHQVLMNLYTNAYHAMEETGGTLDVELSDLDIGSEDVSSHGALKPGRHIILTVRDTGHGIDPSIADRIFDPFFTTKGPGKGTGLGLSVVHGIVKNHQGEITVESKPGEGTAFHVLFPLFIDQHDEQVVEPKRIALGNGEHILFVDDEELLSEMARELLEGIGYKVTARTNGRDALEAFLADAESFNLVITDYTMPEMSGMELAKQIMLSRPDIPIIICTGYMHMIDQEKMKKAGIREFVRKPIIRHVIAEAIKNVLTD